MRPTLLLILSLTLPALACGGGEYAGDGGDAPAGAAGAAGDAAAAETGGAAIEDPLQPPPGADQAPQQPPPPAPEPWEPSREPQFHFEGDEISDEELGEFYVEMEVAIGGESAGSMTFTFWPEKAPQTVRNFLRYCDEGFYDGKTFHRILRDFVIQGGSPDGTAAGTGPYGSIPGEFSDEDQYDHLYGTLSMARSQSPDSASSQFFVVCAETPQSVNLDGQYASFGRLVHGVDTLEAIANVPVTGGAPGQASQPEKEVEILSAVVERGEPPQIEPIERPRPDLGGEPEEVIVQHVLVSFEGTGTGATRSKEEAEKLAQEILDRARAGEDFDALVREHTDDPGSKGNDPPGAYVMLNRGISDRENTVAQLEYAKEVQPQLQEAQQRLMGAIQSGEKTEQEAMQEYQELSAELQAQSPVERKIQRAQMIPAFGDVAFSLEVGGIGVAEYDPEACPYGWHVIKRVK